MKLYIRFGSLFKFQQLHDGNPYLQKILTQESATSWLIEDVADLGEIKRILVSNRINYAIKEND